jgi:transposase InsO family protein
VKPLCDFAQLQLGFVDQIQWRDERLRPLVLFEGGTATPRAQETHTPPQTVRKLMRHCAQQGLRGLLPDNLDVMPPRRVRPVPEAVVEEMARLKPLYAGLHDREVARLVWYDEDSPHGRKPRATQDPAPHPYNATAPPEYWLIDGRKMDGALDGTKWWSMMLLDGDSRTRLAGAVAPSEARGVALMVLYTACLRYGAPQTVISDSGGASIAEAFEAVCQRLQIHHERSVSTQGASYKNLMATHCNPGSRGSGRERGFFAQAGLQPISPQ